MIFFCVWLRVYSREVLRESFGSPKTSTIIGVLVIIGILVAGCPSMIGLLCLTSSIPQANTTSQAQKLQSFHRSPPPSCGWAFGLDLFPPSYPTQRAKPKNSSHAPPCRRPAPSFGRRQPAAGLRPPAQPHWQIYA